jgi:hypothetical protein
MSDDMLLDLASVYSKVDGLADDDDEELALDLMADSEASTVPAEQSPALVFLRRTARELQRGTLSVEDFLVRTERLQRKTSTQMAEFSRAVNPHMAEAYSSTKDLASGLVGALKLILGGCERWFDYEESLDMADVEAGLVLIEDGFLALDEAEEVAHEGMAQSGFS